MHTQPKDVRLRSKIRAAIIITIIGLLLNGLSAVPLKHELNILLSKPDALPNFLRDWWVYVDKGITETNNKYPFMRYGFDWLAFAHIVIAVAFIGPLKDPVKNIWVIQFGRIACLMIFPLAFIAGPVRHIPFFWQLIDCSFGVIGLIPLTICFNKIKKLEAITTKASVE